MFLPRTFSPLAKVRRKEEEGFPPFLPAIVLLVVMCVLFTVSFFPVFRSLIGLFALCSTILILPFAWCLPLPPYHHLHH